MKFFPLALLLLQLANVTAAKIQDAETCKEVALEKGMEWGGSNWWNPESGIKIGCFQCDGYTYYNTNPVQHWIRNIYSAVDCDGTCPVVITTPTTTAAPNPDIWNADCIVGQPFAISSKEICVIENAQNRIKCQKHNENSPYYPFFMQPGSGNLFSHIIAGTEYMCILNSVTHKIQCWSTPNGFNKPNDANYRAIFGGDGSACALQISPEQIKCWGHLSTWHSGSYTMVAVANGHACGLEATTGRPSCFTSNGNYNHEIPEGSFDWLSANNEGVCGIRTTSKKVTCWGSDKMTIHSDLNVYMPSTGMYTWLDSAGPNFSCAISKETNQPTCWGEDFMAGVGGVLSHEPTSGTYHYLACGHNSCCAIESSTNQMHCWGNPEGGHFSQIDWDSILATFDNVQLLDPFATCSARNAVKECICTNGDPVPIGDDRCLANGAEQCEICHTGFKKESDGRCARLTCTDNGVVPISESCFCAGHTDPCLANNWCYDAICKDTAKFPACIENAYYKQDDKCICGSETTTCASGKYCNAGVCSDTATCQIRADVNKKAFYGAHLDGTWDSVARTMTMSFPVPADISVKSIIWNQATDPEALRFSDSVVNNLWSVDTTTDPCEKNHILTVTQSEFFGDGSHFVLNGTHMKTTLRVTATEKMRQQVGTHLYKYDRQIINTVPLLVELVKRTTIDVKFKTTVPEAAKKTIKLNYDYDSLTDAQKANILAECTATYSKGGKVVCERLIEGNDGKAVIEIDTTTTGSKSDLLDVIDDVNDNGFVTTGWNVTVIEEIPHEEFVFFIGSVDNFEDTGVKTISLTMEIHGRTCINHTLSDTGVRLADGASQYIDENVASTTFSWKRNETTNEILQTLEYDLCVETLTWTFAPTGYMSGMYEIGLEFTLAGEGMGTFTTEAEIELVQADVIADIGFRDTVKTYTTPECEDSAETGTFHIGDKFYAKISLSEMVVDAETITCDKVTLTQTRGSDSKEIDLKADGFHFYQSATVDNSVVCGAELEAPLFANVDGYHTNVDFEILVDYKLGSGGDSGNQPTARRFLRKRLSTSESARDYRDPEESSISKDLEILEAEETAVGMELNDFDLKTNSLAGCLFFTGIVFTYVVYEFGYKNKNSEFTPLLEM